MTKSAETIAHLSVLLLMVKGVNIGGFCYSCKRLDQVDAIPPAPFAVLLPAYSEKEVSTAAKMTPTLLESGCIEFCCIGSSAEQLHDLIDEIIEDRDMFSIVTTFHSDVEDACDYFLLAAGGGTPSLWALTAQHPSIAKRLMALIDDAGTNV